MIRCRSLPLLLAIALGGPVWAENPHPPASRPVASRPVATRHEPLARFHSPSAIEVVRVGLQACALGAWLSEEGRCLSADVLVAHACGAGSAVCLDGASYPLDALLAERLALDFGAYATVALRAIEDALALGGYLELEELKRAALRAQRRIRRHVRYQLLPHVWLPTEIEVAVGRLAQRFSTRARQELVITSGPRTPESQAAAMYLKLVTGGRLALERLYRKTEAAKEIKKAYQRAAGERKRHPEIIRAMAATIRAQIARGVYISPHLKGGAVDIRSRNLRARGKAALVDAVAGFHGMRLIREEKMPPHFHLEIGADEEHLD